MTDRDGIHAADSGHKDILGQFYGKLSAKQENHIVSIL